MLGSHSVVQYTESVCACLLRSRREISKNESAVLHFERPENIIFFVGLKKISNIRRSIQKQLLELSVLLQLNKDQTIVWWAPCETSASPHGSVAHRFGTTEVQVPLQIH